MMLRNSARLKQTLLQRTSLRYITSKPPSKFSELLSLGEEISENKYEIMDVKQAPKPVPFENPYKL